MATKYDDGPTWKDMPAIDRVGPSYKPLRGIHPFRKSSIVLLAAMTWERGEHALLFHDDKRRTFLRGRCSQLGLDAVGDEDAEFQCEELYGLRITRAVFSGMKGVYVLTDGGILLSSGSSFAGQLGRPNGAVPWNRFGRVHNIRDVVVSVAAGWSHVLALTRTEVFAFGSNMSDQAGTPGIANLIEPHPVTTCGNIRYQIHGGTRPVACGMHHSVILTANEQIWSCGKGEYTGQGQNGSVPSMTIVGRGIFIPSGFKEVGCTYTGTYALKRDGTLYVWGLNIDGRLGVDPKSTNDVCVMSPTLIDCGGRRISSVRCSRELVVAVTKTGEAFFWGLGGPPQLVQPDCHFPREMFSLGEMPDSGGTVFLEWSSDSGEKSNEDHRNKAEKSEMTKLGMLQGQLVAKRILQG